MILSIDPSHTSIVNLINLLYFLPHLCFLLLINCLLQFLEYLHPGFISRISCFSLVLWMIIQFHTTLLLKTCLLLGSLFRIWFGIVMLLSGLSYITLERRIDSTTTTRRSLLSTSRIVLTSRTLRILFRCFATRFQIGSIVLGILCQFHGKSSCLSLLTRCRIFMQSWVDCLQSNLETGSISIVTKHVGKCLFRQCFNNVIYFSGIRDISLINNELGNVQECFTKSFIHCRQSLSIEGLSTN